MTILENVFKLFPDEYWDFYSLTCNPNISIPFIFNNKEYNWNYNTIFWNTNIKWEDINSNLFKDIPVNYKGISENPNVSWDIIQANPDKDWDWCNISRNPSIDWNIIQANLPANSPIFLYICIACFHFYKRT
mgnify:CR=1 FL=1